MTVDSLDLKHTILCHLPPLPSFPLPFTSDSEVGTVEATDPDGDTVSYYIEPNTINSENFEVNGTSGIIHTSRSLDREVHDEGVRKAARL